MRDGPRIHFSQQRPIIGTFMRNMKHRRQRPISVFQIGPSWARYPLQLNETPPASSTCDAAFEIRSFIPLKQQETFESRSPDAKHDGSCTPLGWRPEKKARRGLGGIGRIAGDAQSASLQICRLSFTSIKAPL